MKYLLKQFGIACILLITEVAIAADDLTQKQTIWFSSDTSTTLNPSSMALAGNHVNRGIRFAHKAIKQTLNEADQLIANHNLCIGHLSNNKRAIATPYCDRTFDLSRGIFRLSKVRGAYRLSGENIDDSSQATISLLQVLVSNIYQHNARIQLSQLTR